MNTHKFTDKASIYKKFRPNYPKELLEYLYAEVGFSASSVIADIGSGTGILSKQILDRGSTVWAVEPNDHMRSIAESALSSIDRYRSINATAENTTLLPQSVDYITVAQAFHWFDQTKFKQEAQKILKPNGKVILIWNSRVINSNVVRENANICKLFCQDFKGFSGGMEENPESLGSFYKNGQFAEVTFDHPLIYSLESFIGRNLSASYAPKINDRNYEQFVEAITDLFHKYCQDGALIMPNVTRCYVGEV